jgi:pimeloyl-ACP methyl ester carboxylesterase
LGAIGLAAYARSRTLAPLALCPALGTAIFLSTANGIPDPVDRAALLSPGPPPPAELADLISATDSRELLLDATARLPTDLAQQRLTLAARWLQLAASAISTADAFVALGIALETITGDESKSVVVERITRRAAVFLARAAPDDKRDDVYYDELKRAKRLYDLRSRAAHGQYDEWNEDQPTGDRNRDEFHRFVLDVILGFREHARERNMRTDEDFGKWWRRAELQGLFV